MKDLDERGIIRIGAEVRPGDILVGKVTPKGETELTAEERLLRAIFGEKAREVRDSSLRVPHGEAGKIVSVKVFTRENGDELPPGVNEQVRVHIAQKRKISEGDKMAGRHGNKGVVSRIMPREDMPFLPSGEPVQIVLNPLGVPSRMNIGQILETHLGWAARALGMQIEAGAEGLADRFEKAGYDVEKYGMPETVEIDKFGEESIKAMKMSVPVFDGAHEEDMNATLDLAGVDPSGKTRLYDGRTGEPFDNYDEVMKFVRIINHPHGLAIGARHITISTCGLVNMIERYSNEGIQTNLAISLHAPNDEIRDQLMPVNKAFNMDALRKGVADYIEKTNRRVTFEYILLDDVNDSLAHARQLAHYMRGLNAYVNLIPYNSVDEHGFKPSSHVEEFKDELLRLHINCTVRKEHGRDIDGACGQLRAKRSGVI